jgi:LysR family hydrogen peroxide-inducible transcriptional activator
MTLTQLRYIVSVADKLHFGKASEACFVSQPTLSVGVKSLEDELGCLIFERRPGAISVTVDGARIVMMARQTLDAAARIKAWRVDDKPKMRLVA